MSLRQKILIGIGAALALLFLFLALLPSLIDLDRYRGAIAARAEKALGRKVSLGNLRLSFLRPGAEVRGIRIAERPGFGEKSFLEAEALAVRVELLPLLLGQVKITKAVLDQPRIVIVHDETGGWNIDDLLKQPSAGSLKPSAGDQKLKPPISRLRSPLSFLPALSLSELDVRRGQLLFIGKAAKVSSQITDLSLKTSQPSLDAPITFHAKAVLTSPQPSFEKGGAKGEFLGEKAGIFELEGRIDPKHVLSESEGAERLPLEAALKVRDLRAQFVKSYFGLPGSPASPTPSSRAQTEGIGRGLDIAGSLDLDLKVHGPLNRLNLEGELDFDRLKIAYAGVFRKVEDEEGRLTVKGWWSPGWMAQGGEKEEGLTLDQVDLRLKGLTLSGRMRFASLKHPKVQFFLSSPSLDLDQFRVIPNPLAGGIAWASPETKGQKLPSPVSRDVGGRRLEVRSPSHIQYPPSSRPSGFSADGKVQVAHLRISGLTFQNLASDILYRQAVLRLRRLTASLDGGKLWADLEIDLSRKYPRLALSSHLEGVKTGPLFQALKQPAWSLEGVLNLRSTITLQGPTPWGLGTASGWGSLTLENGRVKGSKAFDRLVEAFASFLRSAGGEGRLQKFDRLQGAFTLEKGFVQTRDLSVSKGGWQLLASGTLGLLDSSLDFDLVAKLPQATLTAKLSGTVAEPLVVPKGGHLRKRVEIELPRRKGLKGLLKELFQ